jgi:hypothetical protein
MNTVGQGGGGGGKGRCDIGEYRNRVWKKKRKRLGKKAAWELKKKCS